MAKKKLTIDDLLLALKNPEAAGISPKLANTVETWSMIGASAHSELATKIGIPEGEVNDFLKTWVEDNPYANI